MKFRYSKENLTRLEQKQQRLLEMLPGLLSWSILLGIIVVSLINPILASVATIAFIFYWFLRLVYMTIFLLLSFMRLKVEFATDWISRIKGIDMLSSYIREIDKKQELSFRKRLSLYFHKKEVGFLKDKNIPLPSSSDIYHFVIFPVAKEPEDVIRPGLEALLSQSFPLSQILVIYAVEQRAPQETKNAVERLVEKHKNNFLDIFVIVHPDNLPGEAKVKGANVSYAARQAAKLFASKKIAFENIVVSCFDADTVVDNNYFACLTYNFIITPDRTQASFQPLPVYNNNIWDAPWFTRVMEVGSSFFQLIEIIHPESLVTFSSHSMSFKALTEIDYWPKDMISDDSAVFWKAYIHYNGKYRVIPLYITVSMDAAVSENWQRTLKNIYKQRRRWAYGVENFPILVRGFMSSEGIPLKEKIGHAVKMLDGHVSWATWGFILTILGWLPVLLASHAFHKSVLYYNAPYISGTIFHLSTFSLACSIFVSMLLLPSAGGKYGWLKKVIHVLEWIVVPFAMVSLNALPALDAQTRLLFGRYMEFWVTDKSRKVSSRRK